jgi:murein DD-endopeptidase MepM/ murein hydrolase activator NlpD
MPAPQRLGAGSLTPSARPVSNFLQFKNDGDPAQPTRPAQLGQVSGVNVIQRQADRSVQGVNPIAELTEALKPLTQLYDYGAEYYASAQYKRGQNEILKAASNINRDTIRKSIEYAKDNRDVSAVNPVAGVLMDQANPFRQAGRVNQASQFVASKAQEQFRGAWASQGSNLAQLDPSDNAITAIESRVTSDLAGAFGLDEFSPGFQEYAIPEINKGWEWLREKQNTAHVKYQKEVGARQTGTFLSNKLMTGASDDNIINFLAAQSASYGLVGEPVEMAKKAYLHSADILNAAMASPDSRQKATLALRRLMNLPSGIPGLNVAAAYGEEIVKGQAASSRDIKTLRDNKQDAMAFEVEQQSGDWFGFAPGSPEWQEQDATLAEQYPELSPIKRRQLMLDAAKQNLEFQELNVDTMSLEQFYATAEDPGYDEGTFRRKAVQIRSGLPTAAAQKEFETRANTIIERKRRQRSGELDSTTSTNQINNGVERAIRLRLGEDGLAMINSAKNAGIPISDYIAMQDINETRGIQRFRAYITEQGENAIIAETAKNGGILLPGRQSQIWVEVTEKALKDKELMDALIPVEGLPAPAAPAASLSDPPPAPVLPPKFFSPQGPVPQEVIDSGAPIYNQQSTIEMLQTMRDGGPVPASVRRAATASGMTPGEFLLENANRLGLPVPPDIRRKVKQNSNQAQGVSNSFATAAPTGNGPMAIATRAFVDILTPPARAATRQPTFDSRLGAPAKLSSFRPQVSSITYDTNQSGIDVFFENKQFPAVLPGRVKEVNFQGGDDSGYGNFIVVESRDPATGAVVDVLYSHLANASTLRAGQPIEAGQIIGRQGGTGRVRSADGTIASIDFLAPAPAGSKSMTPYSNYDQLRRSIAQQLGN